MIAPFKFGVGGPLGSGRQWISWIALDDVIAIIRFAIANAKMGGPVNAVSPNPVRNAEFARTAGEGTASASDITCACFRATIGARRDGGCFIAGQPTGCSHRSCLRAGYQFRYAGLGGDSASSIWPSWRAVRDNHGNVRSATRKITETLR